MGARALARNSLAQPKLGGIKPGPAMHSHTAHWSTFPPARFVVVKELGGRLRLLKYVLEKCACQQHVHSLFIMNVICFQLLSHLFSE